MHTLKIGISEWLIPTRFDNHVTQISHPAKNKIKGQRKIRKKIKQN